MLRPTRMHPYQTMPMPIEDMLTIVDHEATAARNCVPGDDEPPCAIKDLDDASPSYYLNDRASTAEDTKAGDEQELGALRMEALCESGPMEAAADGADLVFGRGWKLVALWR